MATVGVKELTAIKLMKFFHVAADYEDWRQLRRL